MKITKLISKEESEYKIAAGIMTGTSLDGVDILLLKIKGSGVETSWEEIIFDVYDIPDEMREKIREILNSGTARLEDICRLNYEMADLYRDAVLAAAKKAGIAPETIDYAAVSGQTFYHIPGRATLQLGDGAYLASLLGIPVAWNFRASDIAAGGQGAPLVPYLDYVLFSKLKKHMITLNVGGISNLTYIPAGGEFGKIMAFDCGPGNMIIDRIVIERTAGKMKFDEDAKIALSGKTDESILNFMKSHPYIEMAPPKSTGREKFGDHYTAGLIGRAIKQGTSMEDLIRTATEFTAWCIVSAVEKYIISRIEKGSGSPAAIEMACAGGGAKNPLIFKLVGEGLSRHGIKVSHSEDYNVPSKSKEALLMAVLGNETCYLKPSNVPSATGAGRPVITGTVSQPNQ